MAAYKIGKYEFDTKEEYVRGISDVKRIKAITDRADIFDPETAASLYRLIMSGRLQFQSPIGRRFCKDIQDIVAKNAMDGAAGQQQAQTGGQRQKSPPGGARAQNQVQKQATSGQQAQGKAQGQAASAQQAQGRAQAKNQAQAKAQAAGGQQGMAGSQARSQAQAKAQAAGGQQEGDGAPKEDKAKKILGTVCFVAAIICFIWYFWMDFTNYRGNKVNDYLKRLKEESQEDVAMVSNEYFEENAPELEAAKEGAEMPEEEALPPVLDEYAPILEQNPDFAGWITIEGTKVDNPVMLTREDPDYYLKRNFNGEDDINGTLFMDGRTSLGRRSTNIIIYGHNMRSGAMFGDLEKYLDADFWSEHQSITFDTIYEKGIYEVFAVCLAQVQYQGTDAFRYYDFIEAESEEDFDRFLDNVNRLAVFAEEEQPSYGDELLTLSTCNNFVEDGRLFLVARKSG